MVPPYIRSAFALALISLVYLNGALHAQWTVTAPNLLGPITYASSFGGAMCYRDGNLWVGWKSLYLSQDEGVSFRQIALPLTGDFVRDIRFFDKFNGLIVTDNAVYSTRDEGNSWTVILGRNSCYSADFASSPNTIIVAGSSSIYVSHDAGATWTTANPGGLPLEVVARASSGVYLMTEQGNSMRIYTSLDNGASWTPQTATVNSDTYSVALDSCNPNAFYVANEAAYARNQSESIIWTTQDNGTDWLENIAQPRPFYVGSIATGLASIYVGTITNGILRSTDKGTTWQSIGGPSIRADDHMISAITDNIVVAVDSAGSVWRTTNSGGSSVDISILRKPFAFTPISLFGGDILSICDSPAVASVVLTGKACQIPSVLSQAIVGSTADSYTLISGIGPALTGDDSITISFYPSGPGLFFDTLILALDDGSSLALPLLGRGKNPTQSIQVSASTLFAPDTLSACDSMVVRWLTIKDSGCIHRKVLSENVIGAGLHYEIIQDLPPTLSGNEDSIFLTFTASTAGSYPAILEIVLDDSTTLSIPLLGCARDSASSLSASVSTLFANESLTTCDSPLVATVVISSSGCVPISTLTQFIVGPDSSAYRLLRPLPSVLTGSDTVTISFRPDSARGYNSLFRIVFDNDDSINIDLLGSGRESKSPVISSTKGLFSQDTVTPCDSAALGWFSLSDTSCNPRTILSEALIGNGNGNYSIFDSGAALLGLFPDSIAILFSPNVSSSDSAILDILLSDGSELTVALLGMVSNGEQSIHITPMSLINIDTISACGPSASESITLVDSSCHPRRILSVQILGADSNYYTLTKNFEQQIGKGPDSAIVSFQPDSSRAYSSLLKLTFSDSSMIDIPLHGSGAARTIASLATSDLTADIIGQSISIPIIVHRNGKLPGIVFCVHYDTSQFVYDGTTLNGTGKREDIAGMFWTGRSLVEITTTEMPSDSIVAFVNLEVFPMNPCATVSIDSASFIDSTSICATLEKSRATSTICSSVSCGTEILSNYLRRGTLPAVCVSPNPSNSEFEITSNVELDNAKITLSDDLGGSRYARTETLLAGVPTAVSAALPSGHYFLTIESSGVRIMRSILIIR